MPLDLPDREIERLLAVLSVEERERAGDPPLQRRKRQYVARQAALRSILAQRAGSAPDKLQFVRSMRGKPALAGERALRFSVSDSGDLALVALADRDIGVDVERIRDRPAVARAAALGIDRFYGRWTMLEATGKALGTGLVGLRDGTEITCSSLDVGPGFAAAVAIAADEIEVRLHIYEERAAAVGRRTDMRAAKPP